MGAHRGSIAGGEAGDEITVKVLRLDADSHKISLGLKQLLGDPWSKAGDVQGRPTAQRPGAARGGLWRVRRARAWRRRSHSGERTGIGRDGDLKKAFPIGKDVQFVVTDVDAGARRIRLSLTDVQKMREADEVREYTERGDESLPRHPDRWPTSSATRSVEAGRRGEP